MSQCVAPLRAAIFCRRIDEQRQVGWRKITILAQWNEKDVLIVVGKKPIVFDHNRRTQFIGFFW